MKRIVKSGLLGLLTGSLMAEEPILQLEFTEKSKENIQISQATQLESNLEFFSTKEGKIKFYDPLYPALLAKRIVEIQKGEKIPKDRTVMDIIYNYAAIMREEGFVYNGIGEYWERFKERGTNITPRFTRELKRALEEEYRVLHPNFPSAEEYNRAREALRRRAERTQEKNK